MRSVVVDYARQRLAQKRGGDQHRVTDLPEDIEGGIRLDEDMLGLEPGSLDQGRPLHGIETLQTTPRLASTTRESRLRSAWTVIKRIDELLTNEPEVAREFRPTIPGALADLAVGPVSS